MWAPFVEEYTITVPSKPDYRYELLMNKLKPKKPLTLIQRIFKRRQLERDGYIIY